MYADEQQAPQGRTYTLFPIAFHHAPTHTGVLPQIHSKLTSVCHLFATYTSSLSRTLLTCHPSLAGTPQAIAYLTTYHYPNPSKRPIPEDLKSYNPAKLDSLYDMLAKYEQNFEHHLKLLLDALDYYAATETVSLSRLCAVLGSAMGGSVWREERLGI